MSNNVCKQDSMIAQLKILNDRVNLYAGRLWQMSFVYLGFTILAYSRLLNSLPLESIKYLTIAIITAGLTALIVIRIYDQRIESLIKHVGSIEDSLNLKRTMESQKVYPHYGLVVATIILSIFLGT